MAFLGQVNIVFLLCDRSLQDTIAYKSFAVFFFGSIP